MHLIPKLVNKFSLPFSKMRCNFTYFYKFLGNSKIYLCVIVSYLRSTISCDEGSGVLRNSPGNVSGLP